MSQAAARPPPTGGAGDDLGAGLCGVGQLPGAGNLGNADAKINQPCLQTGFED